MSHNDTSNTDHLENKLLPLPEFRRRLGNIGAATLYRWEKQGLVKLIRIGGRTFGTEAELARLASSQQVAA